MKGLTDPFRSIHPCPIEHKSSKTSSLRNPLLHALLTCIPVSPFPSALTDELRVLTEISRNRPPLTPLESALTDFVSVTCLESALTKTPGAPSPPALSCPRQKNSGPINQYETSRQRTT